MQVVSNLIQFRLKNDNTFGIRHIISDNKVGSDLM